MVRLFAAFTELSDEISFFAQVRTGILCKIKKINCIIDLYLPGGDGGSKTNKSNCQKGWNDDNDDDDKDSDNDGDNSSGNDDDDNDDNDDDDNDDDGDNDDDDKDSDNDDH